MATQITLNITEETYRRAQNLAQLTGRDIADILADTLDISLQTLSTELDKPESVAELSDAELLALADSQMNPLQASRFSDLNAKQAARKLNDAEAQELLALVQLYQEGLLRKAQALNEAVQRGLRKPLES